MGLGLMLRKKMRKSQRKGKKKQQLMFKQEMQYKCKYPIL